MASGKNKIWTADINVELPINMYGDGLGKTIEPETIVDFFTRTV